MKPATLARGLFVFGFVGLQLALIATARDRPDRVFGFQMFNESSSLKFELVRKIEPSSSQHRDRARQSRKLRAVAVNGTSWQERLRDGSTRTFDFTDRVRYSALQDPSRFRHASYGAEAQLFRLQHALDDALEHLPQGSDTRQLGARVEVIRNGRQQPSIELWSRQR